MPEYIKEKQYSWYIQMDKNGKVIQIDKVEFRESLFNFRPTDVSDKTKGFNLTGYIHAEYTEEAIKILDEQRKWALDNNVWGNDRAFRSY